MRYLLIFILFLSPFSFSAEQSHTAEIRRIYPIANGDFVLSFKTESEYCTNGSSPKHYYVSVGENSVTQEGSEKMLSVALMAASTGRPITIRYSDTTNQCFINRLLVGF